MADNRLYLTCQACVDDGDPLEKCRLMIARLPVGGDWGAVGDPEALAERIAAFINHHRWCNDFDPKSIVLDRENDVMIASGATTEW